MRITESKSVISRRRALKFGGAAAAATIPWVHIRTAGAAGTCSIMLWDHWVPAGNVEMKRQIAIFADKTKTEVKADFITSQGNQTLLTINAEAQAKTGHDVIDLSNWTVQDVGHLLEPMDDIVGRLEAKNGKANQVANYLGKHKGKWAAVPKSWGTQNKGPSARISLMKDLCGIDVKAMYPAATVPETALAKAWTMDAFLKAAEAAHKGGKAFALGLGTTSDSVDAVGSIFRSFGAELIDAQGKIQINSAACRQALEYCAQLVKYLPADAQSFDDASNNRALISGNSALIYNPPSAWAVAVRDNPTIGSDIWHFPTPSGPKGRFIPNITFFWGVWQFAKNKSAARDLIEFLMEPEYVDARSASVMGYDLPPYEKMAESRVWDKIGPPEGSVFNYPVRAQHNAEVSIAHMPAPPDIAVQIYNRGTLPTMLAKLKAGESMQQVIGWGTKELEGFI